MSVCGCLWHRKPLRPHCWRPLNAAHAAAQSICIPVPHPHLQHPGSPALQRWPRHWYPCSAKQQVSVSAHAGRWEQGDRNTMVLLSCPSGSRKGCHHNEHIHCRAAARHLQKLISEDRQRSFLQTAFSDGVKLRFMQLSLTALVSTS